MDLTHGLSTSGLTSLHSWHILMAVGLCVPGIVLSDDGLVLTNLGNKYIPLYCAACGNRDRKLAQSYNQKMGRWIGSQTLSEGNTPLGAIDYML